MTDDYGKYLKSIDKNLEVIARYIQRKNRDSSNRALSDVKRLLERDTLDNPMYRIEGEEPEDG